MYKYFAAVLSFAAFLFSSSPVVNADTIKMKNGDTHQGKITAEEETRVQMKIEGSGARVWFMREQILSLEKDAPEGTPDAGNGTVADPPADTAAATGDGDDVTRAQELLEKMRQQPKDTPTTKKKLTNSAPEKESEQSTGSAPVVPQTEIDALIEQLRKAQYYDRLEACKKLGTLGAKDAIPHLIHTLDDEDYYLRKAANDSLIQITGQNFGYDAQAQRSVRVWAIEKWEKWYKEENKKESGSKFKVPW
ncbi:MAG: HEAT repeat domain-containing protein [Candidatus Lindowbacteria bacterium]|nr:HEAT repeat domain-containing protein [Candidatus Lindowbacteria bacterium]